MTAHSPDDAESRLGIVLLVFAGVVAALWALSSALAHYLPAAPADVSAETARQFAVLQEMLRPEPTERRIFLIDVVALPVLTLLLVRAAPAVRTSRSFELAQPGRTRSRTSFLRWNVIALALFATLTIIIAPMGRQMLGLPANARALVMAVAVAVVGLLWRPKAVEALRVPLSYVAAASAVTLGAFLAFYGRTLDVNSLRPIYQHWGHLDSALYSVTQSVAGRTPLADFPSQYGFYGALLAPWFRTVGLSVWTFTLTMNALQWLALLALAGVALREVRSLPLAMAACASLFYVTAALSPMRFDGDLYLQYTPVRLLFPALALLAVSIWLRRPTRVLLVAISFLCGIALVWNLDSGIAVAGSWLGLLAVRLGVAGLVGPQGDGATRRSEARTFGIAAAAVATPVLLFLVWVFVRARGHVDLTLALRPAVTFYGAGVSMLPLPRGLHPWLLVAGIYAFGFVFGAFHLLRGLGDRRTQLMLYLSLLGIGLFVYYQGRSHDAILPQVSWPALMLAFMISDRALHLSEAGRLERPIAFAVALPTLALGTLCALLMVQGLPGILQLSRERLGPNPWHGVADNIAFLRARTSGQRDVVLLARFQGVYFAETGLVSSIRGPGVIETVTHADGEAMVRQIDSLAPAQIFVGEWFFRPRPYNPFNTLLPILAAHYDLAEVSTSEELRRYVRRP